MTVYIVAYDLNQEIRRPPIVAEIRRTACAMLSESSYAIDTAETPRQVYTRMQRHLDGNDTLYVIKLSAPWSGQGPHEVNAWLQARLGSAS